MKPSRLITTFMLLHALVQIEGQTEIGTCGLITTDWNARLGNGFSSNHHWPWHAVVYHQNDNSNSDYKCGGTLISKKSVLTAAHCVHLYNAQLDVEIVTVSLGRLNLAQHESSAQSFGASKIFIHPDYTAQGFVSDIAVIKLSTHATFNTYVQPICLWKSDKTDISEVLGKMGTVVGWGITENGTLSSVLQQGQFPVMDVLTCVKSNPAFFAELLTHKSFCAGNKNGTGLCKGDSGGSITFEKNGVYYIRGIVSVGLVKPNPITTELECDLMQYAVFTDVAKFLPWIEEMMIVPRGDNTITDRPSAAPLPMDNTPVPLPMNDTPAPLATNTPLQLPRNTPEPFSRKNTRILSTTTRPGTSARPITTGRPESVPCYPPCENGGTCIFRDTCECPENYAGPQCQYTLDRCALKKLGFNGAIKCTYGSTEMQCTLSCPTDVRFEFPPAEVYVCQFETGTFLPASIPRCVYDERVQAFEGRNGQAICNPPCMNGGSCIYTNLCKCPKKYAGLQCQYPVERCSMRRTGFNGGYRCTTSAIESNCTVICPDGTDYQFAPAENYRCRYETGRYEPSAIPNCIAPEGAEIVPAD